VEVGGVAQKKWLDQSWRTWLEVNLAYSKIDAIPGTKNRAKIANPVSNDFPHIPNYCVLNSSFLKSLVREM